MNRSELFADQLRRAHSGEAWYGPSFDETLAGVTAAEAAAHPIPGAHSIWELVLHLAGWETVIRTRIGGVAMEEPAEGDFPGPAAVTEEAWAKALATLDSASKALQETVASTPDEHWERPCPGRDYPLTQMMQGAAGHVSYHAGQIRLLRRARV